MCILFFSFSFRLTRKILLQPAPNDKDLLKCRGGSMGLFTNYVYKRREVGRWSKDVQFLSTFIPYKMSINVNAGG